MRPVTTVPRPEIEKMSSMGIRNGRSIGALRLRDVLIDRRHQLVDLGLPLRFAVETLREPTRG